MAKNEDPLSGSEAGRFTDFFKENEQQSFLIRKASIELKVTLRGKMVSVGVSFCNHANQSLAESISRVQQQIMGVELKNYCGQNPYAYLLALYNDQGWAIQQTDSNVPAKKVGKQ